MSNAKVRSKTETCALQKEFLGEGECVSNVKRKFKWWGSISHDCSDAAVTRSKEVMFHTAGDILETVYYCSEVEELWQFW